MKQIRLIPKYRSSFRIVVCPVLFRNIAFISFPGEFRQMLYPSLKETRKRFVRRTGTFRQRFRLTG